RSVGRGRGGGEGVRERFGCTVLALKRPDKDLDTHPGPEVVLEAGDTLIVLGTDASLRGLAQAARAGRGQPGR
ncbi:MAG: TrkA C-terminal domain-containing protein, partial [Actinomycetota bacterium]